MAVRTTLNVFPDWNTNAGIRAWVAELIAGFTAMGWVQTADTGQLDPATVTPPGADGVVRGYLMFRMADTLQATAPVFVRFSIEGTWTPGPATLIKVGTGTDGAGNLTGRVSPTLYGAASGGTSGSGNSAGSYGTWRWSGATNRIVAWINDRRDNDAHNNNCFCIERTHDAAGADTAEGLLVAWRSPGTMSDSGWLSYFLPFEVGRTASAYVNFGVPCLARMDALFTAGNASAIDGSNTGAFPWHIPSRRGLEAPLRGLMTVMGADAAVDVEFDVTHYGATQHMLVLPSDAGSGARTDRPSLVATASHPGFSVPANWTRVAMRYE